MEVTSLPSTGLKMLPTTGVVVVVLVSLTVVTGQDYCKICADHTMCKYKGDGSACVKKIYGTVDANQQKEILQIHNDLRRKIATGGQPNNPAASNMREMTWDAELAKVAQMWANQCTYGHDACRDVTRFKVGQNVRYSSSTATDTTPEWTKGVQSWYDEVSLWKAANIEPFETISGAGHFTQVVWAESNLVGCGISMYTISGKTTKLYVCNYAPRGNIVKGSMYKKGTACSACPAGTTCKNSLCA